MTLTFQLVNEDDRHRDEDDEILVYKLEDGEVVDTIKTELNFYLEVLDDIAFPGFPPSK